MGKLKILISNSQNVFKISKDIRPLMRRCCKAVLQTEQIEDDVEVSVLFVNNKQIQQLNAKHRNKDVETDVLSFQMCDKNEFERDANGVLILGDIVISLEKAVAQAEEYNHSIFRELAYLTVHSMLHLLHYDHENSEKEAAIMREKEEIILSKIGLSRDVKYLVFSYEN